MEGDFLVQSIHQCDTILGPHSLGLGEGRSLGQAQLGLDFLEQLERAQVVGVSGPGAFRVGRCDVVGASAPANAWRVSAMLAERRGITEPAARRSALRPHGPA